METHFARAARATPFQRTQLELIVGSLLGDGTLLRTTVGYCFRAHHGLAQRFFVDWKYDQLRSFVRSAPRTSGEGYYFRTISHPALTVLRTAFYAENHKVVPIPLLREYLTPFALAVWIIDDGAADGRQLRLNTQSFTRTECQQLVAPLHEKFAVNFSLNSDRGRPRLRCQSGSMELLRSIVGAYVLPELCYKLGYINT